MLTRSTRTRVPVQSLVKSIHRTSNLMNNDCVWLGNVRDLSIKSNFSTPFQRTDSSRLQSLIHQNRRHTVWKRVARVYRSSRSPKRFGQVFTGKTSHNMNHIEYSIGDQLVYQFGNIVTVITMQLRNTWKVIEIQEFDSFCVLIIRLNGEPLSWSLINKHCWGSENHVDC